MWGRGSEGKEREGKGRERWSEGGIKREEGRGGEARRPYLLNFLSLSPLICKKNPKEMVQTPKDEKWEPRVV